MLRLPLFCLVPTLLTAVPLAATAQAPVDSVVRTTTVTTVTTTTVTKPAVTGSKPTATTTTSSSTTTAGSTPAAPAATPPAAARQPGPGDLVGARPAAAKPVTAKPAATAKPKTVPAAAASRATAAPARAAQAGARSTAADPELARLLQTNVDLSKVRADELPNLYERFLETTRSERRQWTSAQWESASAALARLNARYQQLRADISLEDKLNIRTLQGEFRTLEAAKQVSKRL